MPLFPSPLNATWAGAGAYGQPLGRVVALWNPGAAQWIAPQGLSSGQLGSASLTRTIPVTAGALYAAGYGHAWVTSAQDYQRRQFRADASWFGAKPYAGASSVVRGSWSGEKAISPAGIPDEQVPSPSLVWSQFAAPQGFDALATHGEHFALFPWQYAQPQWVLNASLAGKPVYTSPSGYVEGKWALPAEAFILSMIGWDSAHLGAPAVEGMRKYAYPQGFDAHFVPVPQIVNGAGGIKPTGWASQAFGAGKAWNFRQYLRPSGLAASAFGVHYLAGGVKYIAPTGIVGGIGKPTVFDPQGDQTIKPQPIGAPLLPTGHAVSPQILYAFSFAAGTIGAHGVGRPPSPLGFDALRMGALVIEYKTKTAGPEGIFAYESGYPVVRDRAQKLFVQSAVAGGIFGDVAIRNNSRLLIPPGLDASTVSPYAQAQQRNKVIAPIGYIAGNYSDNASVENSARSLPTQGFDALRMGRASETGVGYPDRAVNPSGIGVSAQRFGAPMVHRWPEMLPAGWLSQSFGTQTVQLKRRLVLLQGFMAEQVGIHVVGLTWRKVSVMDGMPNPSMDKPQVSHGVRSIIAAGDIFKASTPAPWVSRRVRTLAPEGAFVEQGRAHNVAGSRFIDAIGFEATRWGTRIIPERKFVYPAGMFGAAGLPVVTLMRRLLGAWSFASDEMTGGRWGTASLWNRTQFVTMYYFRESELNPPEMRGWTKIENRNRVVLHHSTAPGSLTAPQVQNKARAVIPAGIPSQDPPHWYKAGQVAARVRPLYLDGIEWAGAGRWAVVFNDARVIYPAGLDAQAFGIGIIESNRRFIGRSGTGFDAVLWGAPFVADAIRGITFKTFDLIVPPKIPLPEVKLYTRYVNHVGPEMSGIGNASLVERFNRLTTRWAHRELSGVPAIKNLTPEMMTRGRASDEYGDTLVRLQWRPVAALGEETLRIGRAAIADSRRTVRPASWRSARVSDRLTIKDTSNPVLYPRYVAPVSFPDTVELNDYVPVPQVNGRVIFQDNWLFEVGGLGDPVVHANSIRVEPGYFDLLVAEPNVWLRQRRVDARGIEQQTIVFGKPRLTHHTIWCTHDATHQAVENHDNKRWGDVGPQRHLTFGRPRIELLMRRIQHRPNNDGYNGIFTRWGSHGLANRRQYIRPTGSNASRFGFHEIPGGQRILEQFSSSSTMAFGTHKVAPPPYFGPRTVKPIGVAAQVFGATRVENQNRSVFAAGWLSQAMGESRGGTPFMWQGLRIGPPIPFIAGGYDALAVGEQWVSHRVRELGVEGFDAFLCTYTPQEFKWRMRVTRPVIKMPTRFLQAVGPDDMAVGMPAIRLAAHYIRPDGNADQYRKGAF